MTWLLFHRGDATVLAGNAPVISADELARFETIGALLTAIDRLHGEAAADVEAERVRACLEGHAEGLASGRAAAQAETDAIAVHLELTARRELDALADMIGTLALEVVRRIAETIGPEQFVAALARQTAEALLTETRARLRVHASVAGAVSKALEHKPLIAVMADPLLAPTDCVFETDRGAIIASLNNQLDAIDRSWGAP